MIRKYIIGSLILSIVASCKLQALQRSWELENWKRTELHVFCITTSTLYIRPIETFRKIYTSPLLWIQPIKTTCINYVAEFSENWKITLF